MTVWPFTITAAIVITWLLSHLILITLAFILAAGIAVAVSWRRTIGSDDQVTRTYWRIKWYLRPGPGFAGWAELTFRWGRTRAVMQGGRYRPSVPFWARMFQPATNCAVRLGRAQFGRRPWARGESPMLVHGPTGAGKTGFLAETAIPHAGPQVNITTRDDMFRYCGALRAMRAGGSLRLAASCSVNEPPVLVLNPMNVAGIPSNLRWSLVKGCADPVTANRRASALTGAGHHHGGDLDHWIQKATTLISACLMAADLSGVHTIEDVAGWIDRYGRAVPERIVRSNPRANKRLRAALMAAGPTTRTVEGVRSTAANALAFTTIPSIVAAVSPEPGTENFDPFEFVRSNRTVFMIVQDTGEASTTAGIFTALFAEIHFAALIEGSKMGRLDPPLSLNVDEATNAITFNLPALASDSRGRGERLTIGIQGYWQAVQAWGEAGAETLWQNCTTKIMLRNTTEAGFGDRISGLCGPTGHGEDKRQVVPAEFVRMLPDNRALVIRENLRPVVVRLRNAWERRDVKRTPRLVLPQPVRLEGVATVTEPLTTWQPAQLPADSGNGHSASTGNGARHD